MTEGNKDNQYLKVLEAYTRDVGRGVARIYYDTMDSLNASTGDIIEIKGKHRTVAKCLPLYPSDEGKGRIRVDGLVRNNAGVAMEDTVTVKKSRQFQLKKLLLLHWRQSLPSMNAILRMLLRVYLLSRETMLWFLILVADLSSKLLV